MPRKKETPPPLFRVRHEFFASVEAVCHQATMLLTALDTVLNHGDLKPSIKEALTERSEALREALMGPDHE
jgi:hypothetical protein